MAEVAGSKSGQAHYMIDFSVDDMSNKMGIVSSIVQVRKSARGEGGVAPGSRPGPATPPSGGDDETDRRGVRGEELTSVRSEKG